jgi:anaerobic magnesium-protoporphyrin IX monomethyl ester cyclase
MQVKTVLLVRVTSVVDKVDHPQFFDPPYALKFIQARLQEDTSVAVHLLDCWIHPLEIPALLARAAEIRPDLLVVSSSSFDAHVAHAFVAGMEKDQCAPLVIGIGQSHYLGRDVHAAQERGYDAILLGEPEEEFFRLLDQIRRTNSSSGDWRAYYWHCYEEGQRFAVEEPDRLTFPTYTSAELESYRSIFPVQVPRRVVWGYLIATRGCPHGCVFCSEVMRVSVGRRMRSRSAANVADEMEHLARQGVNICSFQDDSFSADRRLVQALCEELTARNSRMPWMARVRVDELDYEVLSLMKKAGCVMLGLGVESGSQRIIEQMQKQYRPQPWVDLCRQVFCWTRQLGIGTNAYYVIGNPTETRAEIEQTIRLALELNSDTIQVHFYTPYPGSAAWDRHQDMIAKYDATQMFHYATPMFSLAEVSVEELVKLRSQFYRRYIFRVGFGLPHMWKHAGFYWPNPDIFGSLLGIRKIFR